RSTTQGGDGELGAVERARRYRCVLRSEDLGEGRAVIDGTPNALLESVHIDVPRMSRIHRNIGGTAGWSGRCEDARERGAGLPIETSRHQRMIRRPARQRTAVGGVHAAHAAGYWYQQVAVVIERHVPDRTLEEHVAARDQRPVITAIAGFVDAYPCLG